ncbi:MAG: translocation/assembly module TamB [Prevotella sp.]|jgi:hypothetical protein|nr:translocation/assembly module TamB [Prevotella sp.]
MEETEDIKNTPGKVPKKKSPIKKIFKTVLYMILAFAGFNALLYTLLSIPCVQRKVTDFAVNELKSAMKTEVSIDEVRLSLFNNVRLNGIYVEDQAKDTLLYAGSLNVLLDPWRLIGDRTLEITGIRLDGFVININRKDSISDFNFRFVMDALSGGDTTKATTAKSPLAIIIEDVDLKRGRLNYDVASAPLTPRMFNASHISLYDFDANASLNSIDAGKLDIALNSLSVKERSGVEIKNMKGRLFSEKSQLWVEGFSLALPESHLVIPKAGYDLSNSAFEISVDDTVLSAGDLAVFFPELKLPGKKISLKTDITGTLPAVNIENISLAYGNDFIFEGAARLGSYERYGASEITLSVNKLKISAAAIADFAGAVDSAFVVPAILKDMGDIYLKGKLAGQLNKFRLSAETWCRYGLVSLLATGAADTTFTNFNVAAGLETQNFNLGKLSGNATGLGALTARVDLKAGQSEKKPLTARIRGSIDALQYEKETMTNILFDAFYNALKMGLTARADWETGKILVDAGMSQAKAPDINVRIRLDSVHVDRFYKNTDWVNPRLTLAFNSHIKGLDVNDIAGKISLDSLDFHDDNFSFTPGKFTLESGKKNDNSKYITLTSSLLTANIAGQYSFLSLPDELSNLMNGYLPAVFPTIKRTGKDRNNFTFNFTLKNAKEPGRIFALPVDIVMPVNIDGQVNTIDKIVSIKGNIPHLRYQGRDIKNTKVDVAGYGSAFGITASGAVSMEKGDYKLSLDVDGEDNSMHSLLKIKGNGADIDINGNIEARAQFNRNERKELVSSFKVVPSDIMINKLALNLLPAEIINAGTRTEIHNAGLGVNRKKYFEIAGVISMQDTDTLRACFSDAEIGDLLEALDVKNIRGRMHGNILFTNILDRPGLYTKGFRIADIVVFSDTLGTMSLDSRWSDEYGGVAMQAALVKAGRTFAEVDGTVYTSRDSLDLQLRMEKMPLGWMQPFVSDMLNKVDGSVSSNLMIEGGVKAPLIRGFLGFNDARIGVDYTNVTYTISDTIRISPDKIGFDNLTLKDDQGNTANVSATVTHRNFDNLKYSLDMRMDKLMVLNTGHRTDSLFYGRVYASGNVKINGDNNGVNMNLQMRNDKNSRLNILLPQHAEAADYKSVVYIKTPEEKLKNSLADATPETNGQSLPVMLTVKLDVTPDLAIGIIMDKSVGDEMQAKGNGTVTFNYNMLNENMSAYGDYTLTEGAVKLNLQNIKKLDFNIRNGSKLHFIGDPAKTGFDITAYRRVRASLETLDPGFAMDNASSKALVDCVLGIAGNMNDMNLTYNISLPDSNEDVQQKVNTYISTDEQKIKQFASLIAMGTFYPSTGSSGVNFGDGLWTSLAGTAMSGVLSSLVGNMLGDKWQIGANVESNDGTLSDVDMRVNVSRKFQDEKLVLKTDLGYRASQSSVDNAFIGNFDLEYRLNTMWTLRAYSHTNDKYYRQAPTTQGAGIVYSKEAATLKRLFQSFKPGRFGRNGTQQEQGQTQQQTFPALPADSTQIVPDKPGKNEEIN